MKFFKIIIFIFIFQGNSSLFSLSKNPTDEAEITIRNDKFMGIVVSNKHNFITICHFGAIGEKSGIDPTGGSSDCGLRPCFTGHVENVL